MACYHPMTCKMVERWNEKKGRYTNKIIFNKKSDEWKDPGARDIEIPCGQCVGCRLEYSRQWAVRIMLEAKEHEFNWFVTLTYDNEHLPPFRESFDVDLNTGEVLGSHCMNTLCSRDLTLFMKRLRSQFEREYGVSGIRFYACGEYGSASLRPHYHICLFGCPLPDLKKSTKMKSHSGCMIYESDFLSDLWGKGLVAVGELTFESAAYTARYMMKKHKGVDSDWYEKRNVEPEFVRMSRKPGIAYNYYDKNSDRMYEYDRITLGRSGRNPLELKPGSYFDRLYDLDDPEDLKRVKEERRASAMASRELRMSLTDLNRDEYLAQSEETKFGQVKRLKREC